MTEPIQLDDLRPENAVSRRNLFLGAGAAALAAGAAASLGDAAHADALAAGRPHPLVLDPAIAGLTYIGIDATAFLPDSFSDGRVYQEITGVQPLTVPNEMWAPIHLPVGSVIRQLNIAYQGQPIVSITKRPLAAPTPIQVPFPATTTTAGGGPQTQTFNLATPVVIEADATYCVRTFHSAGASVLGVTLGYTAPLQGFVPATGNPRVLDTRAAGGGGKLAPNEERTVVVGVPGARSALFNLAVVNTEGVNGNPGGFVACFPANIAYPGNSSINWFGAGQILSNSVLCALDPNGAIKIRGGANRTDVVIDRIGLFF